MFDGIEMESWLNLVCSVYLREHSSVILYASQSLQRFRGSFLLPPLADDVTNFLDRFAWQM